MRDPEPAAQLSRGCLEGGGSGFGFPGLLVQDGRLKRLGFPATATILCFLWYWGVTAFGHDVIT